jgi:imidazole glycerol-phosphate synthase subunit HisF
VFENIVILNHMRENIRLPVYCGASMEIFRRAEILRNNMTDAEKLLCNRLNYKQVIGFRFRRQSPVNQFIVDFYCHKAKLVIELDGEVHSLPEVAERDNGREYMIKNFGIEVMRFNNNQILTDIESIVFEIKQRLTTVTNSKPL